MTSLSAFKRSCLLARSHSISLAPQGYWLNESPQHILLYIRRRLRLIYLVCVCELTCSQVCDCSCLISVGTWYLSATVHYDIQKNIQEFNFLLWVSVIECWVSDLHSEFFIFCVTCPQERIFILSYYTLCRMQTINIGKLFKTTVYLLMCSNIQKPQV